jgi:ankyrin repeat protein
MSAALRCRPKVARLLLEKGADVQAADLRGKTALSIAEQQGSAEMVKLLSYYGAH